MRFTILLLGFLITCSVEGATARKIWIDTDPAIGAPWREVDDAFALALAFHSPEVRIVGVSTTYGNAGLKRTTAIARDLVRRFGSSAGIVEEDVHSGVRAAGDRTHGTPATNALANALRKERLTYVALGPLTNLANFLQVHPSLAHRIDRVLFVGGKSLDYELAFGRNGWLRIHDANVIKDPDAARRVLQAVIPLVLVPVETASHLVLEREHWRRLHGGGPAARFLHGKSAVWIWFWTSIVQHRGGPLFDSLAVVLASKPDLVRTEIRYASVRGTELVALDHSASGSRRVRLVTHVTAEGERLAVRRLQTIPVAERGLSLSSTGGTNPK